MSSHEESSLLPGSSNKDVDNKVLDDDDNDDEDEEDENAPFLFHAQNSETHEDEDEDGEFVRTDSRTDSPPPFLTHTVSHDEERRSSHQPQFTSTFGRFASRDPETTVKCRLCRCAKTRFHCVACLKTGQFLHSDPRRGMENFVEKKATETLMTGVKAGLEEDLQRAEDTLRARDRALADAEERLADRARRIAALEEAPRPDPEQVSVPVIPADVSDSLAEIAARAEALALELEEGGADQD